MATEGGNRPAEKDPFLAFQFKIKIDSLDVAGFSEVSGLEFEREVMTFREGGANDYEQSLAGPGRFPTRLVLRRGLGKADVLWNWIGDVAEGRIERRDITVDLTNATGQTLRSWTFAQVCPIKWCGPALRGDASVVAIEAMEFVHRGMSARE